MGAFFSEALVSRSLLCESDNTNLGESTYKHVGPFRNVHLTARKRTRIPRLQIHLAHLRQKDGSVSNGLAPSCDGFEYNRCPPLDVHTQGESVPCHLLLTPESMSKEKISLMPHSGD